MYLVAHHALELHVQLNICHEITLALRYLHQNNLIHRDLSSNNVLTLGGKRFKVTDFGMSKLISPTLNAASLTQCPGCPAYMSPESLETPPIYSVKLDTFSFGVLTIQVLTCRFPDPSPPKKKIRDPKYSAPIEVPVFDIERRKSHIDLIPPTHLFWRLQVCEENPLVQADALSISSDVALALNHLHLITPDPILHLDVCSSNVLLTPSASPPHMWKAKLAGFRVACYLSQPGKACPGSPYYAAPESCYPKRHSPKTDVFSYGVLLLEMCTGEFPDHNVASDYFAH
ncbi:hypothetical protein EMCRGX_G009886 [Ephydatia muelleri]